MRIFCHISFVSAARISSLSAKPKAHSIASAAAAHRIAFTALISVPPVCLSVFYAISTRYLFATILWQLPFTMAFPASLSGLGIFFISSTSS